MNRRHFLAASAATLAIASRARAETFAIDDIRARGSLRAGLSTFVPWAMRDKEGKLIGWEIDVGTRLAQDLKVSYEPMLTAWDGIIPALLAGNFDAIIGGMTITPQRAQSVDFTAPYSFTGVAIVASKKAAGGVMGLAAFNRPDFTIAVRRGTNAATVAADKLPAATLRQFDDDAQALQEVLNGRAQAWLTSTPKPAFAALDYPDQLYLPVTDVIATQDDAMALRKGDTKTIAVFNEWIAARKADGFLKERFAYWFQGRTWRPLVAQS